MKYSGGGDTDTMLLWGGAADIGGGVGDHFLLDNKLDMDSTTDDDTSTKATMDALDSLLLTCTQSSPPCSSNSNLAELKPLPPFTGYTGHLSINGIPGHHYHAIAAAPQSPPSPHPASETNNNTQVTNNNLVCKTTNTSGATLYYTVTTDQPIVSSSTVDGIKSEYVDYSHLMAPDIEDIAALIGSAIAADTTVPQVVDGLSGEDPSGSRDSWMDLGAWIDNACGSGDSVCQGGGKAIISAESLQEFVASSQFVVSTSPEPNVATSTLQSLLAQNHHQQQQQNNFHQPMQQILKRENSSNNNHSYNTQQSQMSLLQSRLQNGPSTMSNGGIKPEPSYMSDCPSPSSSTSYLNSSGELIIPHTTTGSPPGHVVSTTDNTLLINGRYGVHQRSNRPNYGHMRGMKSSGMPSPDLLINGSSLDGLVSGMHGNYPHTTTATTTTPNKNKNRNRNRKQQQQQQQGIMYAADGSGGLLGKEKPVHRCTICNRGFLNKSNIKVHLRTHTGEKPFRCEVCGKAFRQKAHLIKHQQIHKRIGRD